MRIVLFILFLAGMAHAETPEEALKRIFPHGAITLRVSPPIENSNRIILKMIQLVNRWAPDIKQQYIFYEVFFAREYRGLLTLRKRFDGREYAVFGSKVFLSEKLGDSFYVKYVLSPDLRIMSLRNSDFLALTREIKIPADRLAPAFVGCKTAL